VGKGPRDAGRARAGRTYRGGRTGVDAYLEQSVVATRTSSSRTRTAKGGCRSFTRLARATPRGAGDQPHPTASSSACCSR